MQIAITTTHPRMLYARLIYLCLLSIALIYPARATLADTRLRGMQVGTGITPADIQVLGSWKANIARYQLYFADAATASESEYFDWLEEELDKLEALLPYFAAANIKVLIVLQSPPGGLASLKPKMYRMFKEAWAQTDFFEVWTRIATRFVGNQTIWGYALINEPAADPKYIPSTLLDLNEVHLEAAQRIRAIDSDPQHWIVVSAIYGDQSKLKHLELLPTSIAGVAYTFHFYYPPSINTAANPGPYPAPGLNKKKLLARLGGAKKFGEKLATERPDSLFFVDEFSACRWSPKNGAYRYLKDLISIFESKGWSWLYHAFREYHKWDVELSTKKSSLTRASSPTSRQKLLMKYFAKNTVL
ncbi:MAG: glycoside hydrolase family 5 protein [Oligoflexia bacterium]|nr:glycoside hydrolase family 5 protein [Oligoflexia bacterium]